MQIPAAARTLPSVSYTHLGYAKEIFCERAELPGCALLIAYFHANKLPPQAPIVFYIGKVIFFNPINICGVICKYCNGRFRRKFRKLLNPCKNALIQQYRPLTVYIQL